MQSDAISLRNTIAAHSDDRQLVRSLGQLVVYDDRLRGWVVSQNGNMTRPSPPSAPTATPQAGGSLTATTQYDYIICAVKNGVLSTPIFVSGTTTSVNKQILVSWTAAPGAPDSYIAFRAIGTQPNFIASGNTVIYSNVGTSFTDTGLLPLTQGIPPMALPYIFDVGIDEVPQIWRVRTLTDGTLVVEKSSVVDSLSWSSSLSIAQGAMAGFGVALVVTSSTNVDVFYCVTDASNGVAIYTRHWNGATWAAAVLVYTTGAQPAGSVIRLSAPNSNTLFFTDSSGLADGSTINVAFNSGGWKTPSTWDLWGKSADGNKHGMILGVENNGINVPGYGNLFSTISVAPIGNDFLVSFFADRPVGWFSQGIWTIRVSNVGASGSATTAFWQQPQYVYLRNSLSTTLPNTPFFGKQYVFLAPKIQVIGSNFWITVFRATVFAGNVVLRSMYFMSSDGVHWQDKKSIIGSDFPAAYVASDMIYNQFIVSANRTFLFAYDKVFRTASTSLVGISNTAKQTDLTDDLVKTVVTENPTGQAHTTDSDVFNENHKYSVNGDNDILRGGARVVRKHGWITSVAGDSDDGTGHLPTNYPTYKTELISRIDREQILGKDSFKISSRDYLKKLQDWESDAMIEIFGGQRINIGTTNFTNNIVAFDGAINIGTATLNSASGLFTQAMVGATIVVRGAGAAGADLVSYIKAWNSLTQVVLNDNAGTTVTGATFYTYSISSTGGFQDMTPLAIWNAGNEGGFFPAGGEAHAGIIDTTYTINDNLAVVNTTGLMAGNLLFQCRFKCINSWSGVYFYIAFQAKDYQTYWTAMYNKDGDNKFDLVQSTPTTPPASKINQYTSMSGFSKVAVTFNTDTYYWLHFVQKGNTIGVYYSQDPSSGSHARQTWALAFVYSGVPTNMSLAGIGAKGNLTISTPIGQPNSPSDTSAFPLCDLGTAQPGKRFDLIMRVQPNSNGILRSLSVLLGRFNPQLSVQPDILVSLCSDNGSGTQPADLSVPANILFTTTISCASIPNFYGGGTVVNWSGVKPTPVGVAGSVVLTAGQYYWIWVRPSTNWALDLGFPDGPAYVGLIADPSNVFNSQATYTIYNSTNGTINTPQTWLSLASNWADIGAKGKGFCMTTYVSLNTNGVVFSNYLYGSGEIPKTMEYCLAEIAARSGIITNAFASVLDDTFPGGALDTGADGTAHNWFNHFSGTPSVAGNVLSFFAPSGQYGFIRSNSSKGLIDDTIINVPFKLITNAMRGGFLLRLLGDPNTPTTLSGYYIEFQPNVTITGGTADFVNLYWISQGVPILLYSCPSPFTFPINAFFSVSIVNRAGFYRVFVNNCLVAEFFDITLQNQGYVGFGVFGNNAGGAAVAYGEYRIPDLSEEIDYHAIQPNEKGMQALNRLVGSPPRLAYFARYDGALVASHFNGRSVVDTFQDELYKLSPVGTDDYVVNAVEATGDVLFALREDGNSIEINGDRYRGVAIDSVRTDSAAYLLENYVLRKALEDSIQAGFTSPAVFALEPEDVLTELTTNKNWIMRGRTVTIEFKTSEEMCKQEMMLSQFVS